MTKNQLSDKISQADETAEPLAGRELFERRKARELELIRLHTNLSIEQIRVLVRDEEQKQGTGKRVRIIESESSKAPMVSTRLSPEIFGKLNVLSNATGLSLSALTRLAIGELIMNHETRMGKPIPWEKATRDPADRD
jgi:hypothetical protein